MFDFLPSSSRTNFKCAHLDGRYLERFHATLKKEEVYWRLYEHPQHCRTCLAEFRTRYNEHRPHWSLRPATGGDPWTPTEVYAGGRAIEIPRW